MLGFFKSVAFFLGHPVALKLEINKLQDCPLVKTRAAAFAMSNYKT